LYF
jgi:ral guanine nucleotide dissociation stimulator-like 1